jgi:hypothetical protein
MGVCFIFFFGGERGSKQWVVSWDGGTTDEGEEEEEESGLSRVEGEEEWLTMAQLSFPVER